MAYLWRNLKARWERLEGEAASSLLLILCAVVAIALANSRYAVFQSKVWEHVVTIDLGVFSISEDLRHWVNDGLMTVFFLLVGVEIKRELHQGALSNLRSAMLPVIAALGGMVIPAALYLAFNGGSAGARGWGIPMATDIAFAVGVLALLGSRIPSTLRVFLLTLATVDDIGAILVIAIFYTEKLSLAALGIGLVLLSVLVVMRRFAVRSSSAYVVVGLLFWLAILKSGIHATLAGVVLGLLAPASAPLSASSAAAHSEMLLARLRGALRWQDAESARMMLGELREIADASQPAVERLQHKLHGWVYHLVLPAFALANAGVALSASELGSALASPVTIGVVIGLVAGKAAGIVSFSWASVQLRVTALPGGVRWRHMAGAGLLAGIGFTVSLFITALAFRDATLVAQAKVGIIVASVIAGVAGYLVLRYSTVPIPLRRESEESLSTGTSAA